MRKALATQKELAELRAGFVTMASHEFRTPLTTILAAAESIEHYRYKWAEEKKIAYLQRIQNSVKHMIAMLNDVLILGKVEARKIEVNPEPLDLENFSRELVDEVQLSNVEYRIDFAIQGECGTACVDEKLLRHILSNLLSNAIKYSPKGSKVYFAVACQNGVGEFKIRDEGIGIPLEDQKRLFEPFHRCKNVGKIPGNGLGLAIVKKSVELHGGKLAFASEVGKGTTFTVTMPLNKGGK
jgi:signal transduction histidine kinase